MKHLLITLTLIVSVLHVTAQIGPGIVYDYDGAGFRIKRYYDNAASLSKPGKDGKGQQADTVIGMYKDKSNALLDDKVFVKAYPNPTQGILFIENLSWTEGNSVTLQLSDVSGKKILEKHTQSQKETVNLSNLAPGTYNIRYYINNVYTVSWKIIKL